MNRVIAESMSNDASVVYLGEDVIHGGYYVVTEGLADQFPGRVIDFPPDETSLLGAAMGFSQLGLLPIVEIPYAKYLDCGVDMFHEIAMTYWLSAGQNPVGMIIRLQGFDSGVFGGNFHTSNMLNIPPGVDVCCYSNGKDYVMGFRNAIRQAKAGRVVMFVDCTNLLNLRHLHDKDRGWETPYPPKNNSSILRFDSIRQYGSNGKWAVVTYGNGVVTALRARRSLVANQSLLSESNLDIIDCCYLSGVPLGLRAVTPGYEGIVFADICKQGSGSILSNMVCSLRSEGLLPDKWQLIAAPRTYNPLGSTTTFLSIDDIAHSFDKMKQGVSQN
jgi:pyruvate/2-oxoglutarate/acetoin dehydrogenase E1 component